MDEYRLVDRVDRSLLRRLGKRVADVDHAFDVESFVQRAGEGWPDTLMPRLRHVTDALQAELPKEWCPVVEGVIAYLPAGQQTELGFDIWPLTELLGRGVDRPVASLALLGELGAKAYPEKGVRPFLEVDLHGTLGVLGGWTTDDRAGVRRLASEASRPRLPWAAALKPLVADPRPTFPILTALRDDSDHLVRNSVANHLNDVAKDHPGLVLDLVADWLQSPTDQRRWIAGRALRSLTTAGDARALDLLGLGPVDTRVEAFHSNDASPSIGDTVRLSASLVSAESAVRSVTIEVAVHYLRSSGGHSRKVFKWWAGQLDPGERWSGSRGQHFRDLSTRTHHPGRHRIELLVNGRAVATTFVDLSASP